MRAGNAGRDKHRLVGHPKIGMICYDLEDARSGSVSALYFG